MATGLARGGSAGGCAACLVRLRDNDVVVGGEFTSAGGVAANRVARWDGTAWHALGAGLDGQVLDLVVGPGGDVFASGRFTMAGGIAAQHLARWDGVGWHAIGAGTPPVLGHAAEFTAVAVLPNGDLISDGNIDLVGGGHASSVMRWDGSSWTVLGGATAVFDDRVRTLTVLANGDVVAGGYFARVGAVAAAGVARWDGMAWSGLGAGVAATVGPRYVDEILERPSGDLIVAGSFTAAGGLLANCIARWDGAGWHAMQAGVNRAVLGLALAPNGDVVAAGEFTKAGPARVDRIARFDGATWRPVGAGADGTVTDLLWLPTGELIAGGEFGTLGAVTSPGVAALTSSCAAFAAPLPTGCVGPAGALRLRAEELPWIGSTFDVACTGFAPNALALAVFGAKQRTVPLRHVHPIGRPNCDLLVHAEISSFMAVQGGAARLGVRVPFAVPLLGLQFWHQVLQGELSQGAVVSLSSSNALHLTVGAF
ncbi:MAG: hypothetical protein NXI31_20075 [bacterium]|nr:hypothetical protein [bacterium]